MQLSPKIFIDRATIAARIDELAAKVDAALPDESIVALVVLKGAMPMAMDLVRSMNTPVSVELIRAKSYAGTESTGEVTFSVLPEGDLTGKCVLLIEDIVDTGRTASAICEYVLHELQAAQVLIVTLLDKPARREVECVPDWVGFSIDDVFVVGYGMDYNEAYRDLADIHTMEPSG